MVVQHNLTAMNSNRNLGLTTASQAKSTEKLSSGYKINRAADDAAGLSISEKMRKQIRGLTQASANAEDGISTVQTAEGALNEVHDMLQRMNELAVKASNGTMSENDRSYVQNEVDQLVTEIDRVSETTKFNETYLLKGNGSASVSNGNKATVAAMGTVASDYEGLTVRRTNAGTITDATEVTLGTVSMATSDSAVATVKTGSDNVVSNYSAMSISSANKEEQAAVNLYDRTTHELVYAAGSVMKNEDFIGITTKFDTDAAGAAATKTAGQTVTTLTATITKTDGGSITVTGSNTLADNDATYTKATEEGAAAVALRTSLEAYGITLTTATGVGNAGKTVAFDKTLTNNATGDYTITGKYSGDLSDYSVGDSVTARIGIDDDGSIGLNTNATRALKLDLQVGADTTKENKIALTIESMSAKSLGIDGLKVDGKDSTNADAAVNTIADAIQAVSTQRSALGATQNRLEHTISNLDNVVENTTSAESSIRDTDMATEMVKYSNNNILTQAGQAMLAQANQSNQGVLSLLQ